MTREVVVIAGVPHSDQVRQLVLDIRSAAGRAAKAEPGDRLDVARFEALCTRLEQLAAAEPSGRRIPVPTTAAPGVGTLLLGDDPKQWQADIDPTIAQAARAQIADGRVPVLLVSPLALGETPRIEKAGPPPPAARWDSGGLRGRRAVESRFRAQIEEALASATTTTRAISPSGIQNAVVTEILRQYVHSEAPQNRVNVRVEYRDGSKAAHPFPLRSLPLREELPAADLELRFALLSIRHTEMDAVVHGAWLRNAEVSRPRPAAQTDDFVYEVSRTQLAELCDGPRHVRLYMYQTGLETAVVGFYRALVDHLLDRPRSVSVMPMYFDGGAAEPSRRLGEAPNAGGPRGGNGRSRTRKQDPVVTESALFREGTPWAM